MRIGLVLVALLGCRGASRENVIGTLEPLVDNQLCVAGTRLRSCFELDETACRSLVAAAMHGCITEPPKLDSASDRGIAAASISKCVNGVIGEQLAAEHRVDHCNAKPSAADHQ